MKKITILIILFFVSLNSFCQPKNKLNLDTLSIGELKREKLKQEIDKLSQENVKKDYNILLQTGTLMAALLAAIISIWTGMRSQRFQIKSLQSQIKQHQKDRVSQLLKELGSEHFSVKIASIQALSEYESTHRYLINLLKIETDARLISAIKKELKSKIDNSLPILVEETHEVFKTQLRIATSLIAYDNNRKEIAKSLGIDNGLLHEYIYSREGKRLLHHLKTELSFVEINERVQICKSETIKLFKEWNKSHLNLTQITDAMEELLVEYSIQKRKLIIENAFLFGISFSNLDLSGWSFKNCKIYDSEFKNCDLTNSKFMKIKSNNTSLKNCSLQNSSFVDFELKNSDLQQTKGKNITFSNVILYNCNLSAAKLSSSNFKDCELNVINLQASIFSKSIFNNCKFYSCDFIACFFQNAKFIGCRILKSKFKKAKMIETIFQDSKMYSASIEKSSFKDADFSFIDWGRINITNNSIFTNSTFTSCNLRDVKFDNSTEQTNLKYYD